MRDAYRDDLAAAQLRAQDLEREHAALAAQNAKLEALVQPKPAPAPRRRTRYTTGETIFYFVTTFGGLALWDMAFGISHADRDLVLCFAAPALAAIHVRRWFREGDRR